MGLWNWLAMLTSRAGVDATHTTEWQEVATMPVTMEECQAEGYYT